MLADLSESAVAADQGFTDAKRSISTQNCYPSRTVCSFMIQTRTERASNRVNIGKRCSAASLYIRLVLGSGFVARLGEPEAV